MTTSTTSPRDAISAVLFLLLSHLAVVQSFQCQLPKTSSVAGISVGRSYGAEERTSEYFGKRALSSFRDFLQTAVLASALLFAHPISAGAVDSSVGLMGNSIVFDAMDEAPPIEESVMNGSTTTIIKLREIDDEKCKIKSDFGDVMEIEYVAKRLFPPVTIYDASVFRGTGQPFKFVLGSGVMIPGVDQGLYGMCPGEVRLLKVPPKLAVGLLDPPAKAPLEWRVELVSIDGIIRRDNNDELTRDERNMGGD